MLIQGINLIALGKGNYWLSMDKEDVDTVGDGILLDLFPKMQELY